MRTVATATMVAVLLLSTTAAGGQGQFGIGFDIGNGALVLDYEEASPYPEVTGWLRSGRNGGTWDGPGIMSSAAIADRLRFGFEITGVGSAQNDLLPVPYATFCGTSVDLTCVLAAYTVVADANLDFVVDEADRQILLLYYDGGIREDRYWCQGDFNYDGKVDDTDVSVLNRMYGTSLDNLPEPMTLSLVALGGLGALLSRKRR